MKEIGIVHSIQGNKAKVTIQRSAACGDCGACQVGKEKLTMEASVVNLIQAKAGDRVEVEMNFKNVMMASFIVYGIPLILFILGAALGTFYTLGKGQEENPLLSFALGLIFMAISYLIIKIFEKKGAFHQTYEPHITAIISESN